MGADKARVGACPWKNREAYLARCVVQSQQVLLSTDIDAHCKEMTKSCEQRKRRGSNKG